MVSVAAFKLVSLTLTSLALTMGADHRPGDLPPHKGWLPGFHQVVNQPHRVHGFWVNSTDVLFYEGSTDKLNQMLTGLAAVKNLKPKVVLHAGSGVTRSPWDKQPRKGKTTNWKLTTGGGWAVQTEVTVDVWVGQGIELEQLQIPPGIPVTNGGEIENFLRERQKIAPTAEQD